MSKQKDAAMTRGDEKQAKIMKFADLMAEALPEGMTAEDFKETKITRVWLKPEAGVAAVFIPLRRSGDVSQIFKGRDDEAREARGEKLKVKYVWAGQLIGPAMLNENDEPRRGKPGDLFFFFQPSHPGVADAIVRASNRRMPIGLLWKEKVSTYLKKQGAKREVWDYEVIEAARRPDNLMLIDPGTYSMPGENAGEYEDVPFDTDE